MDLVFSLPFIKKGEPGMPHSAFMDSMYMAYSHGILKKVICTQCEVAEINSKVDFILTKYVPPPISYTLEKLPSTFMRGFLFDILASRKVDKCDMFYGYSNWSLFSLRKAKKLGAATIVFRVNSHPLLFRRLVREEYKKFAPFGVCSEPISKWTTNRGIKELQESTHVLIETSFVQDSLVKYGIDENKIVKGTMPAVNTKILKPKKKSADGFKVLFTGQLSLRKGIQYLLNAWSQMTLKDSTLYLVGPIRPDIAKILKKYAYIKNAKMSGYIPRWFNLIKYYDFADIFVTPSVEDGFCLTVLEAMACGLPVIVTENTGAKDLVNDGKNGFIVPIRDPDALKEKILYFYENENEIKRMGKNARKTAEKNRWEKHEYEKRLMEIYETVRNH